MDKYAKLAESLRGFYPNPVSLLAVEVISVEGDTCTVSIDGLAVDGVFLRPTMLGDYKLITTPSDGSHVLVGSLSGDFKQLVVLAVDAPEKVELTGENISMLLDVKSGVISVKNGINNGDSERLVIDANSGTTTFNGGQQGGLVILQKLVDNLTSIKDYIAAIHNALPAAFTAIGAGATANGTNGATSYNSAMSGKAITIEDMENPKIKQ